MLRVREREREGEVGDKRDTREQRILKWDRSGGSCGE